MKEEILLAIIIPTYKSTYLYDALFSLKNQTCKNFRVYIGNDGSPDKKIKPIVNKFKSDIDLVYIEFEDNLGSISLVEHWKRCINMSTEEWIWLFSDDDIMEPHCVKSFFETLKTNLSSRFYKFSTKKIDKNGNIIKVKEFEKGKNILSLNSFIESRFTNFYYRSYAVEYIFHRSIYNQIGIIDFPLAWCSDDATWMIYAFYNNNSIVLIKGAVVYWRLSVENISSNNVNKIILFNKKEALVKFAQWFDDFCMLAKVNFSSKKRFRWMCAQLTPFMSEIDFAEFEKIFVASNIVTSKIFILTNYIKLKTIGLLKLIKSLCYFI